MDLSPVIITANLCNMYIDFVAKCMTHTSICEIMVPKFVSLSEMINFNITFFFAELS